MDSSIELTEKSEQGPSRKPSANGLALVSPEMQRGLRRRASLVKTLGLPNSEAGEAENEAIVQARSESIFLIPPSSISWAQLNELSRTAPELAEQKWSAIQQAASDELCGGHRAARMNQAANATPIERARHLALSNEMRRNFEPRNGIEEVLLQNLVQAHEQYEHWLTIHVRLNSFGIKKPDDDLEPLETPRLSETEAVEHAMVMVERWQRMFLRCLRALREIHRQPLIIANQVNFAEQQIVSQQNEP